MNGNYGWWLPIQASSFAKDIDFGIWVIHAAMGLIFVVWSVFFVYLLVRYRQRPGHKAEPGHDHGILKSLAPDFAVMAFELLLLAFYAIPVWSRLKMNLPAPEASNLVAVIGEQFAWNIQYPGPDGKLGRRLPRLVHFTNPIGLDRQDPAAQDDVVLANELHLPAGKATLIELTSKDVIHSFFIPEFRLKQDAVPGLRQKLWVEPTKEGNYEISCAQLCGFGHSLMRAGVVVHSAQDYEAWLASRAGAKKTAEPIETW